MIIEITLGFGRNFISGWCDSPQLTTKSQSFSTEASDSCTVVAQKSFESFWLAQKLMWDVAG